MGIAGDLALALDPVYFAEQAGFTPDDWQAQLLRSDASRILLNASRQSGKSTVCGILAAHTALYQPGSLTLMLSRAQRQSGELFRKTMAVMRALKWPVKPIAETALTCELANGSRILALPGSEETIRSFSNVALLLIDEASRVPDAVYASMRPVLAVSGGRLVALSTPFGSRGWWYEAWMGRDAADAVIDPEAPLPPDWERYEVPAELCPRISPAFLAEERRKLGFWWADQEYGCKFLDARTAAFREEDIMAAFVDFEPLGDMDLFFRFTDDEEARDAAIAARQAQREQQRTATAWQHPDGAVPTSAFLSHEGLKRMV